MPVAPISKCTIMTHETQNFDHLLGSLEGLSEAQVSAHLALYAGYVKKLNEMEEKLRSTDKSAVNYTYGEYSELKRRYAVAFNGSYLHQMYFQGLNGSETNRSSELEDALKESFGSFEDWEAEIRAAAACTPGWVVTAVNKVDGKIHNHVMYEHHIALPIHQEIILALDCWEHAFMIDYGTKKADYLNTFIANTDWEKMSLRHSLAVNDKNTHMKQ
jgi:superoxide dismutase, Fe-Mn family